ncbi:hypothetical protein PIB30_092697 [Stylosanthes scabra]|uniref:Uncharacterized protein n=1 Tax=Stylosanthes scabra TaxID=79078 RepID=A0ABU6ZTQ4_9FABA|nr:hypothetical protein [Stylosanthes scabra]
MELLVGSAFTIEVPSSPPHATAEYHAEPPPISDAATTSEIERDVTKSNSFFGDGSGFRAGGKAGFFTGDSSESSSSIGTPDDSDIENDAVSKEDDEEEVQSKLNGLNSLDSLEDSLPIKRGLSNHFSGKSKSFSDLSQVNTVKDLKKQENPFNKRRRVLMASKWSRRSFYTWSNPKSMPLLPLDEDSDEAAQEQGDDEDGEDEKGRKVFSSPSSSSSSAKDEVLSLRQQQKRVPPQSYAEHMRLKLGSFKSRSLSLADLQEHDEEEDEEEEDDNDDGLT